VSDVVLLADNDVVIKLSRMDVYEDALKALNVAPRQVGSLAVMLRYMGKASESNRLRIVSNRSAADRLARVLHGITEIEPTQDERALAAKLMKGILSSGLDMQEGEVALIAVALLRERPDIATADKRAIRSLPPLAVQEGIVDKLQGRVICLEQIMKALCKAFGLPRVRNAVAADRAADTTITQAYDMCGNGGRQFMGALDAVIKERIVNAAPGWLKRL
jgi:hypothetical protein